MMRRGTIRERVSAGTARSMGESAIADFVQMIADSCYGCAGDEEGGLDARRSIGRDLRVGVRGRNRGFRVPARRRTHCGLALLRRRCGRQPVLALDGDQQEYNPGDVSDGSGNRRKSAFEATPVVTSGVMYLSTPFNRVIALDPETGRERWSFDPKIDLQAPYSEGLINRGVTPWTDSDRAVGD